jgi:hypothetical protein
VIQLSIVEQPPKILYSTEYPVESTETIKSFLIFNQAFEQSFSFPGNVCAWPRFGVGGLSTTRGAWHGNNGPMNSTELGHDTRLAK